MNFGYTIGSLAGIIQRVVIFQSLHHVAVCWFEVEWKFWHQVGMYLSHHLKNLLSQFVESCLSMQDRSFVVYTLLWKVLGTNKKTRFFVHIKLNRQCYRWQCFDQSYIWAFLSKDFSLIGHHWQEVFIMSMDCNSAMDRKLSSMCWENVRTLELTFKVMEMDYSIQNILVLILSSTNCNISWGWMVVMTTQEFGHNGQMISLKIALDWNLFANHEALNES